MVNIEDGLKLNLIKYGKIIGEHKTSVLLRDDHVELTMFVSLHSLVEDEEPYFFYQVYNNSPEYECLYECIGDALEDYFRQKLCSK